MNSEQIKELYAYNQWANEKLFSFLNTLNWDDFTRDLSNSFGSIYHTVLHILEVEKLWLSRWKGEGNKGLLDPNDFTDFQSIKQEWEDHHQNLNQFLQSLSDEKLAGILTYKNFKGVSYSLELWKQMLHLVNHSSYHRGQIVTMARQLKLEPPSTDLVYYYLGVR